MAGRCNVNLPTRKDRRSPWLAGALAAFALVFLTSTARAGSISFDDGGTLTGSFTYDATANTISAWDFTVSGGSSNFSTLTYSNTISGSVGGFGGFLNGNFAPLNFFSPTGGSSGGGRTLYLVVPGNLTSFPASELPAPGQTVQLSLVTASNTQGSGCDSGPPDAPCSEEGQTSGTRYIVGPAYVDITDPDCSVDTCYTFTYTNVQLTSGGGGGGGQVPEPASIVLLGTGLLGVVGRRLRLRR